MYWCILCMHIIWDRLRVKLELVSQNIDILVWLNNPKNNTNARLLAKVHPVLTKTGSISTQ